MVRMLGDLLVEGGGRVDVGGAFAVEKGLEVGVLRDAEDLDVASLFGVLDAEADGVAGGEVREVRLLDPHPDGRGACGDKFKVLAVKVELADADAGGAVGQREGTLLEDGAVIRAAAPWQPRSGVPLLPAVERDLRASRDVPVEGA